MGSRCAGHRWTAAVRSGRYALQNLPKKVKGISRENVGLRGLGQRRQGRASPRLVPKHFLELQ